jgi:hypothetical protein
MSDGKVLFWHRFLNWRQKILQPTWWKSVQGFSTTWSDASQKFTKIDDGSNTKAVNTQTEK